MFLFRSVFDDLAVKQKHFVFVSPYFFWPCWHSIHMNRLMNAALALNYILYADLHVYSLYRPGNLRQDLKKVENLVLSELLVLNHS